MTIIHDLLKHCSDTGVMIKMEPTQSSVLTIQDVANTMWSSGLIGTYNRAHDAAVELTNEVGFELTSPRGKFWKRAKGVMQTVLSEYSSDTACFTDTDWASTFDTLRKMFGDLTGSTENITTYRTYWLCPVDVAMILGPKFSLHGGSCYWSSYTDSFKQLLGSSGYMLRGVWGDNMVKDDTTVDFRIGSRVVRVPQFTDYQKADTPHSYAVRTWVIPLKNDSIAIFNGYKATVTSHRSASSNPDVYQSLTVDNRIWDFSPATRDRYRSTNGEVVRFISTDLASHFMANGIQRAVVRSVPKRGSSNPNDAAAFINMDSFSIVGSDDGEFITSGYRNGLNIPEQAYKMAKDWQNFITPKDTEEEILDVRAAYSDDNDNDEDEDEETIASNIWEHLFDHHDMSRDEYDGVNWNDYNLTRESYTEALEEYRAAVETERENLYRRGLSLGYLQDHDNMTPSERTAVELRLSYCDMDQSHSIIDVRRHLLAIRSEEPLVITGEGTHDMLLRRTRNVVRLANAHNMVGLEGELLASALSVSSLELTYRYLDMEEMLIEIRRQIALGWHTARSTTGLIEAIQNYNGEYNNV